MKPNSLELTFYNKDRTDFYLIRPYVLEGKQKIWVANESGEGGTFDLEFLYDAIHKHFQEVF